MRALCVKTVSKRIVLFTDFVHNLTFINIHPVLLAKRTTYLKLKKNVKDYYFLQIYFEKDYPFPFEHYNIM